MAIDVWDAITALGSSGIVVFARDWYLTRKTIKSAESTEERNASREPIVKDGMLLNDAIKTMSVFRSAIDELKETKETLTDELRETKSVLGEKIRHLTNENHRILEIHEKEKLEWQEMLANLTTKLIKLESEVNNLRGTTPK